MCVSEFLLRAVCMERGRSLRVVVREKRGKMLKMSTEGGQQNIKFILTSCIGQVK